MNRVQVLDLTIYFYNLRQIPKCLSSPAEGNEILMRLLQHVSEALSKLSGINHVVKCSSFPLCWFRSCADIVGSKLSKYFIYYWAIPITPYIVLTLKIETEKYKLLQ